jgi:hypothetical protein
MTHGWKRLFVVHRKDDRPFAFAGLWEYGQEGDEPRLVNDPGNDVPGCIQSIETEDWLLGLSSSPSSSVHLRGRSTERRDPGRECLEMRMAGGVLGKPTTVRYSLAFLILATPAR